MVSVPLLDIFGKGYKLPQGGAAAFQTPYGQAGVSFLGDATPSTVPTPPGPAGFGIGNFQGQDAVDMGFPEATALQTSPTNGGVATPTAQPATPPAVPAPEAAPAANATQQWQQTASERYYARKAARDAQRASSNPAVRDMYRQQTRITPGAGNISGYGTPASTDRAQGPAGMGTTGAAGYGLGFPLKFNNSDWQPY